MEGTTKKSKSFDWHAIFVCCKKCKGKSCRLSFNPKVPAAVIGAERLEKRLLFNVGKNSDHFSILTHNADHANRPYFRLQFQRVCDRVARW
jgi:hypothetical protein